MARRDDAKDAALAASRTLNSNPRAVTDPAFAAGGLAALIPGKPGPKGGHKLTGPVLDHLEALLEHDPRLTYGELAAQAAQRFGIQVHPRSVRRALERRSADREAGNAGPAAPKSGRHG